MSTKFGKNLSQIIGGGRRQNLTAVELYLYKIITISRGNKINFLALSFQPLLLCCWGRDTSSVFLCLQKNETLLLLI